MVHRILIILGLNSSFQNCIILKIFSSVHEPAEVESNHKSTKPRYKKAVEWKVQCSIATYKGKESGFSRWRFSGKHLHVDLGLLFRCSAISTSGKSMGVKHTVLPNGHPSAVAFTVLAQLCGPKANETEMGAAPFIKTLSEGSLI